MNVSGQFVARHFSDTRTDEGRVRFLTSPLGVQLIAEGQSWQHVSTHKTLGEAAACLAFLPQVPYALYHAALNELERRQELERQYSPSAA